jgi:diguanylate cyclase (GGDEF)-like protein
MTDEQPAAGDAASAATESTPVVLVVDDSRVMRVALSRLLSKTYQVIETENGQQGLDALLANPAIELVFADLSMPVMDGFELLRRVRASADPAIHSVPFVVITGHEDDEGMQRKAVELGASDFVSKPFRSTEITTRAKTLIEQRRDMRELRHALDERPSTDTITGLANSAQFTARCEQLLSLAERHGMAVACLLLQLDDFEQWAASLPVPDADQLLRQLADLLGEHVRVEDATGYLGDGRYGVVLSGTDHAGALALAQRLGGQLNTLPRSAQPMPELHFGISVPDPAQATAVSELLQAAQAAMAPLPVAAAQPEPQSDLLDLQQELDQARESQLLAEQAEQSASEKLRALQLGARQQLAKAHQTIATLRSQLGALQAKFSDYARHHSEAAQQQADTEIAQLQATLAERDEQLATEQTLRRDAQDMVTLLQARLADAEQAAETTESRRSLWSRLFGRGGKD